MDPSVSPRLHISPGVELGSTSEREGELEGEVGRVHGGGVCRVSRAAEKASSGMPAREGLGGCLRAREGGGGGGGQSTEAGVGLRRTGSTRGREIQTGAAVAYCKRERCP